MILFDGRIYHESSFENEAELEAVVERYAEYLFGPNVIYLSKKSLVRTVEGSGTIPDAFAIDYLSGTWYLVEVELLGHRVWRHIVPQISNQIVACLNQATRDLLTDKVLEFISKNQAKFSDSKIQQRVVSLLRSEPVIAIPIDGSSKDLETWAKTQKFKISVWEIRKYVSAKDPDRVMYDLPDNLEPSIVSAPTAAGVVAVRRNANKSIGDLIDAGLLADSDTLFLTYKGHKFTGIARREGIQLDDGVVRSPSDAAIRCYAKAGSDRPTENGWRVWRDKNATVLNELFEKEGPHS